MRKEAKKVYRHSLPIRLTHWLNAGCMAVMLMSGLQIFNGWPALYWGIRTQFGHPVLAMYATTQSGHKVGMTNILGDTFVTTGWFGLSSNGKGRLVQRGFPAWATLPGPLDLAKARRLHFFFAWIFVINGLIYFAYALLSRRLWCHRLTS